MGDLSLSLLFIDVFADILVCTCGSLEVDSMFTERTLCTIHITALSNKNVLFGMVLSTPLNDFLSPVGAFVMTFPVNILSSTWVSGNVSRSMVFTTIAFINGNTSEYCKMTLFYGGLLKLECVL